MTTNEKAVGTALPTYNPSLPSSPPAKTTTWRRNLGRLLTVLALGYLAFEHLPRLMKSMPSDSTLAPGAFKSTCKQAPALLPKHHNLTDTYGYKDRIIEWHSGAIQIPTEIFDVMGPVNEDARYKVFGDFAEYLEKSYPLVHQKFSISKVNTYGLVYEWKGTDSSKKPLMLTGHQDVVPVNPPTVPTWTHPPYSGYYDGEYIWGRGSLDDKSGVIGMLSALEIMIEQGFQPSRSLVLAFGFDEEAGGVVSAASLGEWILEKYGKDSMFMLVDEGNGMSEEYGQLFAMPAVAEKGKFDARIQVETSGGHSSVPPPHTGIGILAEAIVALENNPVPLKISRANPVFSSYQCFAETGNMPKDWEKAIKAGAKSQKGLEKFAKKLAESSLAGRAQVATTRAFDLISGGVKVNALPELAAAVANHRINADSSVAELQEQLISIITPLAEKIGFSLNAFGKSIVTAKNSPGLIKMEEAFESALQPAPISPHDVSSPAWNLLSGSVKGTYGTRKGAGNKTEVTMAPGLAIGNTDTRRYWPLTENIYRFGYIELGPNEMSGVHTVDERIKADTMVEAVRFFERLILNVDEYEHSS